MQVSHPNSHPNPNLLQGHLFDQGLINQALEIIEKRGGDFEIASFTATPNDQTSEFNFRRTSSVQLKVLGLGLGLGSGLGLWCPCARRS